MLVEIDSIELASLRKAVSDSEGTLERVRQIAEKAFDDANTRSDCEVIEPLSDALTEILATIDGVKGGDDGTSC